MMNFAFKTRSLVSKTRNCVFKMLNFAAGSAVVYALLSGNESALWAMDGYEPGATMLFKRALLPPATDNVSTTSFAIRDSVLFMLTSDGVVTREVLAAGLPGGSHSSSFNLTALVYSASCRNCGNKTTVANMGEMSSITVDSQGTCYVYSGSSGASRSAGYGSHGGGKQVLFAVNSTGSVVGDMRSSGNDPSGTISQKGWYCSTLVAVLCCIIHAGD